MLANEFRLRSNQRIKKIAQFGKCISGQYFLLKYLPNSQQQNKIAINVSVKVFRQAVQRNYLKRLIRNTIKSNVLNPKFPSNDILIITKPTITLQTTKDNLKSDLKNIFYKFYQV